MQWASTVVIALFCFGNTCHCFLFTTESNTSSCSTAEGEQGECLKPQQCSHFKSATDLLRKRPKICRFEGRIPLICCRVSVQPNIQQCGVRDADAAFPFQVDEASSRFSSSFEPVIRQQSERQLAENPSKPKFVPFESEIIYVPAVHNGQDATTDSWPWMVAIGSERKQKGCTTSTYTWFCGGSLISDRHVLTAAHCISVNSFSQLLVRLGVIRLASNDLIRMQDRRVSRVTHHPDYFRSQNDLAMLTLEAPVDLMSPSVTTICLPHPGLNVRGEDVILAGWGLTEFGADCQPDVLQEAHLRVIDSQKCERNYSLIASFDSEFPGGFQSTKICAVSRDSNENRDACQGDSGGPLIWRSPKDNRFYLVGVVSTGVGCGNPFFPGIYTKVSSYISWIHSVIDQDLNS